MEIIGIRHDWPEKAGFMISRPYGHTDYTFLHFTTPIDFEIEGRAIKAEPGACIFFEPGVRQFFHSDIDVIHNWFHADKSLALLLKRYEIPVNCILYPKNTEFISQIFRIAEAEFFSSNPYKTELLSCYINEFIIKFASSLKNDAAIAVVNRKEREKLQSARRTILSSPEKRWSVAEMADLVSLSPSRFHAVYKSVFGTSPLKDLIDAKIRYASSLLLSDESLILPEVAERLGYNDQYHFIRQFKAVTGCTPGEYRKKNI